MNTRWLKQNIGMILFGIGFVVVLAGLVWQLRAAMAEQQTVAAELQSQQEALQLNEGRRPLPSEQNIQKIKSNIQKLQELNTQLQEKLAHKNIQATAPRSESEFAQLLGKSIQQLASNAAVGEMNVPANYNFGFSRYNAVWPCKDPSVKKEDCLAMLGKQVAVIEQLVNLMITNRIGQLEYIHRAEVEPGTSNDTLAVAPSPHNALYSIIPLELKFSTGPDALQAFINSLATMDWLVAVRNLNIEVAPATPAERMADEKAHATRISVVLRLDVIEFPQFRARPPKQTAAAR